MEQKNRILWIDDEIELLRPHIILLEKRDYTVETATNGEDGIELVRQKHFDLIFLDESMVGLSGLDVLPVLKKIDPSTPIIMATKNEAESVMEEAIGSKIDDYLTKPLNPAQIIAVCKKFLDSKRIRSNRLAEEYLQGFNEISRRLFEPMEWNDWVDVYQKLVSWSMQLDRNPELGFDQTLKDQWRECNAEFSKFVETNYKRWTRNDKDKDLPLMSSDITKEYLLPLLKSGKPTVFFVVDCMRLDQWLIMEEHLRQYYYFDKKFYSSLLPTATPYSRNAIFAGLYPSEIKENYPHLWFNETNTEEHKANAHEDELLKEQLKRKRIKLNTNLNYIKIHETEFGRRIEKDIVNITKSHLTAIVINAVDMIAHSRSDFAILKEIAPDESAYRSLTNSWFQHSSLFGMLKTLSELDVNILITTDHGSIRCMRGVKVQGDRDTSTNLRYKFGKNVKAEQRHAMQIRDPLDYKLPSHGITVNNIIAKEDYYFVYPTDFNHYLQKYRDSFQHGGISMEEMIIPVIKLERK
ncbi:response regulator [Bacteroidota bacterium]